MNEQIQNIQHKIKILAERCRDLEAENEILKEEIEQLKSQPVKTKETYIPTSTVLHEQTEEFEFALKRAKTVKRELEMYLREVERKIEGIKF